jgi:uncharacterized protein
MSTMPKAISDSSTLIHLSSIGRLDLLYTFYNDLVIPPAVWEEVVIEGKGRSGALQVKEGVDQGFIKIQSPENNDVLKLLKRELNDGEAEVIALALEDRTADVLMDEFEARQVADVFNLVKTGVVGILIRAKHRGMIPSLQSELQRLRLEAGFWIDDELISKALKLSGEE